ncbi:glyoxalase [Tersicoccus solisilvae]|uniref:Glyoxalase n=1 Tax=Tersicoccus solisilvae TaxID=1882339 RepID=A0ABQ1NKA1_9MICC|nr:VOC family protein [Tersicoccus solisilvae]GGC79326.1 glyoxalase [Tersicoccus solisilvae]
MEITRQIIVFDAADMDAESAFWASLLGGTVDPADPDDAEDDWRTVRVDGLARLAVQLAPNHQQPDWPDGTPQQIHLDLHVPDIRAAHEEAIAAGARLLRAAPDLDARDGFQVYADPAGHPFCLCWD